MSDFLTYQKPYLREYPTSLRVPIDVTFMQRPRRISRDELPGALAESSVDLELQDGAYEVSGKKIKVNVIFTSIC